MKKINNIKDLEHEKLKLRVKQLELEKQMDRSWKGLRNNFSTNTLAVQKPVTTSFNFKTKSALLNGALNFGTTFLSRRLGIIAGKTVEDAAENIFRKFSQKLNSLGTKRKNLKKVE